MSLAMRRLLLLGPLLLTAGASCAEYAVDAPCGSDRACAGGLVCAFGTCLDPLDQRLNTVDVEIDPGTASGVPVQNVLQVDLSVTPRVDVALRPGVVVGGRVSAGEAPLAATVMLRPALSIPGRALAPQTTTDLAGDFSVLGVDGARYAVTVNPTDPARPPWYAHDDEPVAVEGDDGAFELDPILLPDVGPLVSGRVVAGSGAGASGIPALAVHVERADGRRLSSVAATDPSGNFSVALAAPVEDAVLVVSPTSDNAYFPEVTVPGLTLVDGDNPLGDVELGEVLSPVPLAAAAVDADGAPAAGARLILRGVVGNGLFSVTVDADAEGGFDLLLPPATYEALVMGGPDASAAGMLWATELEVPPPPDSPVVFRLPPRLAASGVLRAAGGERVANATVGFVRIAAVDGAREDLLGDRLVAFEAKTDPAGAWALALDPGRYRVAIRPPPSSPAPAFSEIATFDEGRTTHDVDLPQRAIVAGTVLFDGQPQEGAWVRVYSALVDERGAAILMGEGAAGADGAFEIGVPDLVADVVNPNPP